MGCYPLGALSISLVITLRCKKLPSGGSFNPFKRQEFDRRNKGNPIASGGVFFQKVI